MKIVSLLPSATEIVYALNLDDQLAAVTHECDYPPEATEKPVITSSVLDHNHSSSLGIHKGITGLVHKGRSIYHLNEELLAELKPDLILTQELCEVCAVSYDIVEKAARILKGEREIISLEPNSIWDILENIRLVGQKTGRVREAEKLVEKYNGRIDSIVTATAEIEKWPRVYCMEWIEPPFAAGHWISEMVAMAGGYEGLALAGQPSAQIDWSDVLEFAPEIIILMPCGFGLTKTIEESNKLGTYPGWSDLPAVKQGQVFAVDGSSYFNRPGPRIVDGLEILAQIIHPELFAPTFHHRAYAQLTDLR
ncbi:cobalamin-binding protein [candidate division KSB1 bacterium]|nr:cobalamin-binding protein [candidate division KSB1 bacterium]NIR70918.1 cobalamin-binding protein [candidate division KSB1 bacterium]NIS23090.1 cobalamin-binding protein [candidate division KSB1 bacterium]NIT69925.1 cobalamin-binding protein [candidate division KSB1 bacterium]NIU23591.1 cobalamin-binding protein [candidate division KSB1 bacterium]